MATNQARSKQAKPDSRGQGLAKQKEKGAWEYERDFLAQPNKDKNHLEGTCVQCCWVVLLSNRFCEHRVAHAPPRRRSGSDVSRPSTPRWLAPLISAGTAAVASPESAGAAWRWASSYHSCRSGQGHAYLTIRQSAPSATTLKFLM